MTRRILSLLLTFLSFSSLGFSQGTTCSNAITLYPSTTCGNTCGPQYCGGYQSENAAGNHVTMSGSSTLNPTCTSDNETTQVVEWLQFTATATTATINNETSYSGPGAATAEFRDYVVYSGTCGSLTQFSCNSEIAGGSSVSLTGLSGSLSSCGCTHCNRNCYMYYQLSTLYSNER
jgi:hypothetical protein